MDLLGVEKADVLGVSQGGMIAQHFAVDYPERVGKLVLAVTAARPNGQLQEVVSHWIELAEQSDYRGLMLDSFQKMYTEEYIRKNRWLLTFAGRIGRPDSYERFLIMARACLNHDCYEALGQIRADTLVVGGEKDQVLGGQASRDIAGRIGGSELILYPEYGHALYEQAKDFNGRVLDFLRR